MKVQDDLFDARGRQARGWTNKLIRGDNQRILSSLKSGALRRQIEDAGGLKRNDIFGHDTMTLVPVVMG